MLRQAIWRIRWSQRRRSRRWSPPARRLACHRSQVYDWLPHNEGRLDEVPAGEEERVRWLRSWYLEKIRPFAERYRRALLAAYGRERGSRIEACHVFEISEYARPLDAAARRRLFPFLP